MTTVNPQHYRGVKYDSTRSVDEDAKLIRTEIKEAVRQGVLPQAKYSVKTRKFAGTIGRTIQVNVSEFSGIPLINPARARRLFEHPHLDPKLPVYSPRLEAAMKKLRQLVASYNYDKGDLATGLFDTKFYMEVSLDPTQVQEAYEQAAIELAAGGRLAYERVENPMRDAGANLAMKRSYWTASAEGVAEQLGLTVTYAGRNRTGGPNGPNEVMVITDPDDFDAPPIVLVSDGYIGGSVSYTRIK